MTLLEAVAETVDLAFQGVEPRPSSRVMSRPVWLTASPLSTSGQSGCPSDR
jgi:hypothetical protein